MTICSHPSAVSRNTSETMHKILIIYLTAIFISLALPKTEIVNSDNVALLMTHGGGHVTHLQGFNPFGKNYFEQVMEEFFDAIVYYGEELLKK